MSDYIVSARKYRPVTFGSVVGQGAIAATLMNAIQSGKLAHAYLFCGPRGVGKTTCARIFAKTINCMHPQPNGEACGECESCQAFQEGRSMNIHELDAASNNSVDDIRTLIDQVRIPPQIGRYKVFIIDEVHMLSTAAFNAFLKTLEEPPAHAIFILATTEKHKILPTILSRCQVYDFQRMSVSDIVNHLANVASQEGYTCEPAALNIIAQKADGGMRDALSIFDQVVSYTGGNITYARTIENLNVLDYDYYFRLVDHMLKGEIKESLLLFNEVLSHGFEGGPFIGGLASHLRDVLVSRDSATAQLLEVADDVRARYVEQAARCKPQWLYRAISICNQCDQAYRTSRNKRLQVELAIIECSQAATDDGIASGLRPVRRLNPIFSRLTTGDAGRQAQAPQAPQAHQSASQTASAQTPAAANKPSRVKPTLRLGALSPSLRSVAKVQHNQTAATTVAAATAPAAHDGQPMPPEEDRPVQQLDFMLQWQSFVTRLPIDYKALAQRMQIMQPSLEVVDGRTVATIIVENDDVCRQMRELSAQQLLTHMRTTLHNNHLELNFEVVAKGETTHVYDKHEKLRLLCERHAVLPKFIKCFELELE